jgi:hypothetical protein
VPIGVGVPEVGEEGFWCWLLDLAPGGDVPAMHLAGDFDGSLE